VSGLGKSGGVSSGFEVYAGGIAAGVCGGGLATRLGFGQPKRRRSMVTHALKSRSMAGV
jgi:hypothetical protein